MIPEQVSHVQSSFSKVVPIAETAAQLFYDRLFEIAPDVLSLFTGDMKEQVRKIMAMLDTAVAGLDKIEEIIPAVQDLDRRHGTYGVRDEHFAPVGEALLWTLERGLGDDFTPEVKEAWTLVYGTLAQVMQDGMSGQTEQAVN